MILYNASDMRIFFSTYWNDNDTKMPGTELKRELIEPGASLTWDAQATISTEDPTPQPAYYQVVTEPLFDAESPDFKAGDDRCFAVTDVAHDGWVYVGRNNSVWDFRASSGPAHKHIVSRVDATTPTTLRWPHWIDYVTRLPIQGAGDGAAAPGDDLPGAAPPPDSPQVMFYRENGEALAWYFTNGGRELADQRSVGHWESDWQQIVPVTVEGTRYLIFYGANGRTARYRFNGRDIEEPIGLGTWNTNWQQIVPVTSGGTQYLIFYATDGQAFLYRFTGQAIDQKLAIGKWVTDWRLIVPVMLDGVQRVVFYRASGEAVHYRFNGQGIDDDHALGTWDTDWKQIVPLTVGGTQYLVFYKANGQAIRYRLTASGLDQQTALGTWDTDWKRIVPLG
jgi:hypothetical protein